MLRVVDFAGSSVIAKLVPRTLLVILSAALVAGCVSRRATVRPQSDRAPTSIEGFEELLRVRRQELKGLRAIAQLSFRGPEGTTSSKEALAVARPDRLRVEVLSFFGAVFVLTAADGDFRAYVRQENTIYRGRASPENIWRYARIGLPVPDLVDMILGVPPRRIQPWGNLSRDEVSGLARMEQEVSDGVQIVWFDGSFPFAAEYRDATGNTEWRATFSRYELIAGIPISTLIKLEMPAEDQSVEIELSDVDVNPRFDHGVFTFPIPSGSKVVELAS